MRHKKRHVKRQSHKVYFLRRAHRPLFINRIACKVVGGGVEGRGRPLAHSERSNAGAAPRPHKFSGREKFLDIKSGIFNDNNTLRFRRS